MVWNYRSADCSFENKLIVLFIIIFGTLSFAIGESGWLQMGSMTPVHVIMFPAAILVGIVGGILGAAFSLLNMRIVKKRARLINNVRRPAARKFLRMLEPVVIMVSLQWTDS